MVNDTIEERKQHKQERNVNIRDKIHRSNTVKPHPCRIRNMSTKIPNECSLKHHVKRVFSPSL